MKKDSSQVRSLRLPYFLCNSRHILAYSALHRSTALLRLIYPARTTGLKSVKALGRQPGGTHLHFFLSLRSETAIVCFSSQMHLAPEAAGLSAWSASSGMVATLSLRSTPPALDSPAKCILLLQQPGSARGRLRPAVRQSSCYLGSL